jgi:hypothetical protein
VAEETVKILTVMPMSKVPAEICWDFRGPEMQTGPGRNRAGISGRKGYSSMTITLALTVGIVTAMTITVTFRVKRRK